MAKKEPSPPKDLRKAWKSYDAADYQAAIARLFHFSAKTVNSNTPACGIRLAADVHARLPYVSVSTLGAGAISFDFVGNAAEAGVPAQVLAVVDNEVDLRFTEVSETEVALIKELAEVLASGAELDTAHVGIRLRQMLLPVADGSGYVALTPLHSAGLSGLINRRVRAERAQEEADKVEKRTRRRVAGFPIGGTKPQNLGIRVKDMTRPLVFFAPQEHPGTKQAFSVHFRGVSLAPPRAMLEAFYAGRAKLARTDVEGAEFLRTSSRVREAEVQALRNMVKVVAGRVAEAQAVLTERVEFDGQVSNDVSAIVRGALVPDLRDSGWVRDCAAEIARAIARHKTEAGPGISDSAVDGLRPEIEAAVREYF